MNDTRGGDSERIAPIIPLFSSARPQADPGRSAAARSDVVSEAEPGHTNDAGAWRSTWDTPSRGSALGTTSDAGTTSDRHPARGASARPGAGRAGEASSGPRLHALDTSNEASGGDEVDPDEARTAAEESLVRKLRARSLSVSEARQMLRGHELDSATIDEVIEDFGRRGYLDDAALAEVLVTSGVERKGQGRVALSRALAQRGIPREVIDLALDELPDDDDERALEFARSKARSLARLDHDTALRRLMGQLSRRGYNGSTAMKAAKTALQEATFGRATSGVRFVDSD